MNLYNIVMIMKIVNIQLNHSGVQGALYNIDDRNVTNYEIKETIEGKMKAISLI